VNEEAQTSWGALAPKEKEEKKKFT
jgi:hypothetical protein